MFRSDTVRTFTAGITLRRILDIGCGDGSISLPLLDDERQLTLLDLSSGMTRLVEANVPPSLAPNVEIRTENFMTADFVPSTFDLIICLGVLAHVDSPEQFVAKITALLKPGGRLIVAFTDSYHWLGRISRMLRWCKEIIAPPRYRTNLLSYDNLASVFRHNKLTPASVFRYGYLPLPGIQYVLRPTSLFKLTRTVFGSATQNRNAHMGNEYICALIKDNE
ncbi:MAG: class I SAM-dependent methyltransferase [Bryobacterales bacterium]|nr:class I SAM-dependent methyltransferase [Bryobacterales bacterium]